MSKTTRWIAIAAAAVAGYYLLKKSGALKGLGVDLDDSLDGLGADELDGLDAGASKYRKSASGRGYGRVRTVPPGWANYGGQYMHVGTTAQTMYGPW